MKVAIHWSDGQTLQGSPEDVAAPNDADLGPILEMAGKYLTGLTEVRASKTCLYTMTPDEHFLIDRYPLAPHVCFAAGFSGHGFKFAPVIGKALADLALDGGTALPIGFLGLKRLQQEESGNA